MRTERIIADNCRVLMQKNGISKEKFAEALGYSAADVDKLLEGRLLITEKDLEDIADFLGAGKEDISAEWDSMDYNVEGCMHGLPFSEDENRDKVLDILETYIDLKEIYEKTK